MFSSVGGHDSKTHSLMFVVLGMRSQGGSDKKGREVLKMYLLLVTLLNWDVIVFSHILLVTILTDIGISHDQFLADAMTTVISVTDCHTTVYTVFLVVMPIQP